MTKTKSLLLTAGIVLATAFTFCGCKEEAKEKKETPSAEATTEAFADSRDGKKYKTVKIGEQVWMAENLNYGAEGSKCYGDDPANCEKYGRLYNWETAMKACPAGWRLPSKDEWETLVVFAGGNDDVVGKKLKAKSGWNENGNGTDEFGFSALPGGDGNPYSDSIFYNVGEVGWWWSASNFESEYGGGAYYLNIDKERAYLFEYNESNLLSVRCIKDK